MQIVPNKEIKLKVVKQDIDDLDEDLKKINSPLSKKSGAYYIVGRPQSGKTSLWLSLLLTKNQGYYRKFDKIYLISNSLATLPLPLLNLPPEQIFDGYDEEQLFEILKNEKESKENNNILIVIDDCIKDLKSKKFNKLILNRRHIIQNVDNPKVKSGVMIFITGQTYNLLELQVRKNMSDVILFPTSNSKELISIKSELMSDLNPKQQDEILKLAWSRPYSFLYIKMNNQMSTKYYSNFDLIKI
jgi:hypothetical protein